jgi:pimeloyl-ACP methyl ester carboxylesterase
VSLPGAAGPWRRERSVTVGPVTMALTETAGPGDRVFVLVHGIGMGRAVFDDLAAALAVRGRVLAFDLPGFGDSPEPGTAMSLETTAAVVADAVAQEAPGGAIWVGHSMGTQIVAEAAVQRPELVRALVLIAPTVDAAARTASRQVWHMIRDLAGESPRVLAIGLWQYAKTSPAWFARKLQFMLAHHLEGVTPRIAAPTLVLRGEHDRVCPAPWTWQVAASIPRASFAQIPGRGHEAVIKGAEPVADMIGVFVDDLD